MSSAATAFSPRLIEHEGGYLVALDIFPSMAVVAVSVKGSAADGYGENAWVFFTRTTSHTKEFSPENLPMLMVPEVRRVAIMLRAVMADPTHAVGTGNAFIKHGNGTAYKMAYASNLGSRVERVEENENTVSFIVPGTTGRHAFALDQIFSIHRIDGGWIVTLKQTSAGT
jgi:hypothetical protein